jgi:MFS family permease
MKKGADQPQKTVRVFAAASFLNDLGSDMIYPVWPLFVTEVLKANMAVLGFLDGLGEALVSLSQAASGYLSDRLKRRKIFIWTGYLCGSLSRAGYAASRVWPQLVPFRVLDRVGKIRSAPRDALIADSTTDKNRGRAFGLLRAMDNLGAVVGILLCLALLPLLGYRPLFALAALPSLAGAMLILVTIREDKRTDRKIFKGLSLGDIGPNLRLYVLLSGLFALGAFSYSFLLVFAKRFGFNTAFIPVFYLTFTATASSFLFPGRLSDRIGRKKCSPWPSSLGGRLRRRPDHSPALLVALGLCPLRGHRAALDPVQKTLVCELSPWPSGPAA